MPQWPSAWDARSDRRLRRSSTAERTRSSGPRSGFARGPHTARLAAHSTTTARRSFRIPGSLDARLPAVRQQADQDDLVGPHRPHRAVVHRRLHLPRRCRSRSGLARAHDRQRRQRERRRHHRHPVAGGPRGAALRLPPALRGRAAGPRLEDGRTAGVAHARQRAHVRAGGQEGGPQGDRQRRARRHAHEPAGGVARLAQLPDQWPVRRLQVSAGALESES